MDRALFKGDIDIDIDKEIDSYFGCLEQASQSVQVLLNRIRAVLVLTLIVLNREPCTWRT